MKLRSILSRGTISALATVCCIATASASAFSGLYVFGDSLSDTGNIYAATNGAIPVSPPYSQGRFSNGNLWIQDVASSLGLGAVTPSLLGGNDFAFGGAQTGTTLAHTGNKTDLTAQLVYYNARNLAAQPNALYTLWIGSNDMNALAGALGKGTLSPSQISGDIALAIGNIAGVVNGLAHDGMKHLLALNVPDLGKTPDAIAAGSTAVATVSALAADFNVALSAELAALSSQDGFKLNLVNTYSALDNIVANPSAYNLTNVTSPCWTGNFTSASSGTLCAQTQAGQDKYLFWDGLHPTAAGHQLIADAALAQVPEPGSAGLLVIAIAGVALIRRRKTG